MKREDAEREAYDHGVLRREGYENVLSHTRYYYLSRRAEVIREKMQFARDKDVLELGSHEWFHWLEGNDIRPSRLTCINISEAELEKGRSLAGQSAINPNFRLMDAAELIFDDESFDMVYGGAILHHINLEKAFSGIHRILRRGGRIFFIEPLGINPVAKLVRLLTPSARTKDEKPLGWRELRLLRRYFDVDFYYEQLFSVPFGLASRFLFSRPDNALMRLVFNMDLSIDRMIPPLRAFYRFIIITGTKKVSGEG